MPDTSLTLADIKSENTITHYGVLGMKWGVRKDRRGTGRPRRSGPSEPSSQKRTPQLRRKRTATDYFTDAQLRSINERLRLENEFHRQMSEVNKRNRSRGQKFVQDNLIPTGTKLVGDVGKEVVRSRLREQLVQRPQVNASKSSQPNQASRPTSKPSSKPASKPAPKPKSTPRPTSQYNPDFGTEAMERRK